MSGDGVCFQLEVKHVSTGAEQHHNRQCPVRFRKNDMDIFLNPSSVVVIGVPRQEGIGAYNSIEMMLRYGFAGTIYPVNHRADRICGLPAYPSVLDIPEQADLAVISVGRDRVLSVFDECVAAGIKRVIVISQGFTDADEPGNVLQQTLANRARANNVRVLGPNTLGVLNNYTRFSTGFIDMVPPDVVSPISVIAQSGVIQVAADQLGYRGWGKCVDIGNSCDISFADVLAYFADDPETGVVAIHMEGMTEGQAFLDAAFRASRSKPVVVFKTGRSLAGARAAMSHSGSLVGEDAVFDCAFRRSGLLRVDTTEELQCALRALSRFDKMTGPRVAIVTITGAGGIIAVDACEKEGLELATLPPHLVAELIEGMPQWVSVGNPVDLWPIAMIGGDYSAVVEKTLKTLFSADTVDGVLFNMPILGSPLHGDLDVLDVIARVRDETGCSTPLSVFAYGDKNGDARNFLETIPGVAVFDAIEDAVKALAFRYRYERTRETPLPVQRIYTVDYTKRDTMVAHSRESGVLDGDRALDIVHAYGIPVVSGCAIQGWDELKRVADEYGYPLVLKAIGPGFLHKTERGGVITGIDSDNGLYDAFRRLNETMDRFRPDQFHIMLVQQQVSGTEMLLGFSRDCQFGPVIMCGFGGVYTEIFQDVSRELAPVDRRTARKMVERLSMYPLLAGYRGNAPVDLEALAGIIERMSLLAMENVDIMEADINPIIVSSAGCIAVDARFVWDTYSA